MPHLTSYAPSLSLSVPSHSVLTCFLLLSYVCLSVCLSVSVATQSLSQSSGLLPPGRVPESTCTIEFSVTARCYGLRRETICVCNRNTGQITRMPVRLFVDPGIVETTPRGAAEDETDLSFGDVFVVPGRDDGSHYRLAHQQQQVVFRLRNAHTQPLALLPLTNIIGLTVTTEFGLLSRVPTGEQATAAGAGADYGHLFSNVSTQVSTMQEVTSPRHTVTGSMPAVTSPTTTLSGLDAAPSAATLTIPTAVRALTMRYPVCCCRCGRCCYHNNHLSNRNSHSSNSHSSGGCNG